MLDIDYLHEHFDYFDGQLIVKKKPYKYRTQVGEPIGYLHGDRLRCNLHGRKWFVHQLIFFYHHGYLPAYGIDHWDRNPLNNRIENLRPCDASSNAQNIERSDEVGIILTISGTWEASISIKGKKKYLGTFKEKHEAIEARIRAEKDHYTHYWR
ncbi:TPA: HNH endonuclease [Escherichia coli]|nr:HNH endonuclease [Escherichia coli]